MTTAVGTAFNKRQRDMLIDSATESPRNGQLLVFISTAGVRERHKLGAERAYSIRLNGKPFSRKGPRSGMIRTRRLTTVLSLEALAGQLHDIVRFVEATPGLYGVNVLLSAPRDPKDAYKGDELAPDEISGFLSALPEGTCETSTLSRIDVGLWGRHVYTVS